MSLKDKLKQNSTKILIIGGVSLFGFLGYALLKDNANLKKNNNKNYGLFLENDTVRFKGSRIPYGVVKPWDKNTSNLRLIQEKDTLVLNIEHMFKKLEEGDSAFMRYIDSVLERNIKYGSVRWY